MTVDKLYFSKAGRCYIRIPSKSGKVYLGAELSRRLFKAYGITDPSKLVNNEEYLQWV